MRQDCRSLWVGFKTDEDPKERHAHSYICDMRGGNYLLVPTCTRQGRRTLLQLTTGHGMVRQNHKFGTEFTGKGKFIGCRYICDLICDFGDGEVACERPSTSSLENRRRHVGAARSASVGKEACRRLAAW